MRFVGWSLRLKIVLVFTGFSILIGSALFAGILISTKYTEKYTLKKRLQFETNRYLEALATSPVSPVRYTGTIPVPKSQYMTTYMGEDLMPEWAIKALTNLPEGNYEHVNDKQSYYISIRELQDGQRFYLLYNVTTLLSDRVNLYLSRQYLIITLLPTFIIGLLLGIITSYKVISPVVRLANIIKTKEATGKIPEGMSNKFHNDEIGYLAKTLEHAMIEMQTVIDREKAFARDASHELRTPVTVLNGAVKILSAEVDKDDTKKLNIISRIERASANMEHLINSFLWLSRQEIYETQGTISIVKEVKECIENNNYLIRNKPIKIELKEYADAELPVKSEIFNVVVGNLIRNALTYTQKGSIIISIYETCVSIEDSGPGIPKHVLEGINVISGVSKADGFGFGLSIAHRMCTQLGWKLKIISEEGNGTLILVCFNHGYLDTPCPSICNNLKNTATGEIDNVEP